MRIPRELYQMEQQLTQRLPALRPAHAFGLTLWVYGTVLAKSACINAVLVELALLMPWATARQRLREWLKDGADKARPCHSQVEVAACFPLLLRWVISWWQGSTSLPLAIDAVSHQDRVVALVISVLYRGCAIPVAWHIVPAQEKGAWMPHILALIDHVHLAIPADWQSLVAHPMQERPASRGRPAPPAGAVHNPHSRRAATSVAAPDAGPAPRPASAG